FLLLVVVFFERPSLRNFLLACCTLPLLTWGMIANNRRLVWVELLAGLVVLYFITPFTRLKKRVVQGLAVSLPVIVIYLAFGWNSGSRVFSPVRTLRSVMDSDTDSSTRWRDLENYNLFATVRSHPL